MEIEAKFSLPDPKLFRELETRGELAGFTLGIARTEKILDTYLDTADEALMSAGYACRRRNGLGQIVITVKRLRTATEAVHRREEFELTLPADQPPSEWTPGPARDLVASLIGERPLIPLFDLRQTRTVRLMSRADQTVAVMSLDRVLMRSGLRTCSFRELEIELAPQGLEDDLAGVVSHLQQEWKLPPEPRSKFERALAFMKSPGAEACRSTRRSGAGRIASSPKSTAPGIKPNDPMAEAARKVLLFHFRRMIGHESGTREGRDAEELHDMRVATRRLRAALRVFDGYLNRDRIKPFAKSLRRAARLLGAVRDLDVFRAKTQLYLDRLPTERRADLDALLAAFQMRYESARGELLAFLDTDDYRLFKKGFGAFLQTHGTGGAFLSSGRDESRPFRVRHVIPVVLFENAAHVRAFGEWMSPPDVPLGRYHQLRIACKRLRYALEFFREVLGPDVEDLIEHMKRAQDHLGDLQDAVVASNILRNFLIWGTWEQDRPAKRSTLSEVVVDPGVAAYLAARQAEFPELIKGFRAVWRPIAGKRFNRRLAELATI